MKWFALVLRILVGLPFVVFGVSYFGKFIQTPPPPTDEAKAFMGVLVPTGYLAVVKVLEVVGGSLILTHRFAPLGIVILTPVAVNIALWDVLLVGQPAIGVALTVLLAVLIAVPYRSSFLPLFRPPATI